MPNPSPTPEDQRIYVASRASVLARGEMWRRLRSEGAPIISTWIDEDGPNDTADLDELWIRIRREVTTATRLILYVEPDDFPLKGAFVEIGMALAANVPITIVAPGVEIKDRNCRPFGSWIKHPLVNFSPAVADALADAILASLPQARAVGDEEVEAAARAYERSIFKYEWEEDENWTPDHTKDAVKAMRAALATLPPAPARTESPKPTFTPAYTDRATVDFIREIAGVPEDFPNHGAWEIELPAGHWRALLQTLLQAIPAEPAPKPDEMVAFGASEMACVLYPGEDQQALRAAFIDGASRSDSPLPPAPGWRGALEALVARLEDKASMWAKMMAHEADADEDILRQRSECWMLSLGFAAVEARKTLDALLLPSPPSPSEPEA